MCTPDQGDGLARHVPVLVNQVSQLLSPPPCGTVVDLTIGQAGHSLVLGSRLGPDGVLVGIDVDQRALDHARTVLRSLDCKVILIRGNFAQVGDLLRGKGIDAVDVMLADLGFSSGQVGDPQSGLSFLSDAPLDMRLDRSIQTTAADIVNDTDEQVLADLIYRYGEDRLSRRIARLIVERRKLKPICTTKELAELVCAAYRGRRHLRIHPATRTFQALRIAVNRELDNLQALLDQAPTLLRSGGRFGVISFHSLEDRLVKQDFRSRAQTGQYKVLTKRPIRPDPQEIAANRRARSARLRIAERI